jgi:hypothetical protein
MARAQTKGVTKAAASSNRAMDFFTALSVRGVDSFIATGDPLLTSISNLRKERKEI